MSGRIEGNGITARDIAYKELRRLLTNAGFKPGTRFGEIEWSERLGVYRGAVREALAILSHEGLLSRQGRSFVVPVLDDRDILEIYQVRIALETAAQANLPLPDTSQVAQLFGALLSSGHGDDNSSALYLVLEQLAGMRRD